MRYNDPSGEIFLLAAAIGLFATDLGYDIQKAISPVAVKFDLAFGSHSNGIGIDVSVGVPQALLVSYRYDAGATYYFNRVGGYGSGWQVRNGGEWSFGLPFMQVQHSGTRYRDWGNGQLLADQVVHTIQIGNPIINIAYSNDTKGSFPWAQYIPFLPRLKDGGPGDGSDRYRTASGRFRVGFFETGFFLHTGEATGTERFDLNGNGIKEFIGGSIGDPDRSNGIIFFSLAGFKVGRDSENNRQVLQNDLAHDLFNGGQNGSAYPWVLTLNRDSGFVFQFGNF